MGVEIGDKPSGVVRGECRGGLGGAAAPNRPPSAPAGGGQNSRKRKALVPAGHIPFNRATSPNTRASTNPCSPRRRPKQQKKKRPRARRAHAVQSSDKHEYTSKHEPLLAAQAAQMNLRIIMTNQATLNTRNNHIYLPSVYNALDPMRHLGQFPMLREGVRWHCVARREIAERSEEAPGA